MLTPAMWYSAGQPLWAGFGVLATLWYAQTYRRTAKSLGARACRGGRHAGRLVLDHRPRGRPGRGRLSLVGRPPPLPAGGDRPARGNGTRTRRWHLASGGRHIDATTSFHGRGIRTAANPVQGVLHTCQAIPENLIFANLGLTVHTSADQGVLLSLCLLLAWTSRRGSVSNTRGPRHFGPLELTGAAIVLAAYLVEWTFRGYLDYRFLRTINLRFIVPWYDAVPQIGAVLLAAGWWTSRRTLRTAEDLAPRPRAPTQLECLACALPVRYPH